MTFAQLLKNLKKSQKIISLNPGDKKKIAQIEHLFEGKIPPSYLVFLEQIGHGIINGFEINGTGVSDPPAIEYVTLLDRETVKNLPPTYIYLIFNNDWNWYFDLTQRHKNGEVTIVPWTPGLSATQQPNDLRKEETYQSFEELFKKRILNPNEEEIFRMNYWKSRAKEVETAQQYTHDYDSILSLNFMRRAYWLISIVALLVLGYIALS